MKFQTYNTEKPDGSMKTLWEYEGNTLYLPIWGRKI